MPWYNVRYITNLTVALAGPADVHHEKKGLATKLFRKATFTYTTLLTMARDISDALHHLHTQVHPGATVIHRWVCVQRGGTMWARVCVL